MNWIISKLMLEIWSTDKVGKRLPGKLYSKECLFRKALGVVLHDRALNGEFN